MSKRAPTKKAPQPKVSYRHPVNRAMLDDAPLGTRIADKVTGFLGSWRFIIIQTIIVAIWVAGNVYLLFHFDPFRSSSSTSRSRPRRPTPRRSSCWPAIARQSATG